MATPYFWIAVFLLTAIGCTRVWRDQRRRKAAMARSRDARAELPVRESTERTDTGQHVAGTFSSRWKAFKAERRRGGRYRGERM